MQAFFVVLLLLSLLGLILGLIRPKLAIRWGNKRTRGRVLLTYGSAMLVFFVLVGVTSPATERKEDSGAVVTKPTVTPTPRPTPKLTPTPMPTESPEDFKSSARGDLTYDELARNTESYVGQRVYHKGKVVQVIERTGQKMVLRVNVTPKEYGFWDDTVWVNYAGPRVLKDDIVEFWGVVDGRRKYEAVLGNEIVIPEITARYLEVVEKKE